MERSLCKMMIFWMVLGVVIPVVIRALVQVVKKLLLRFTATEPIVSEIPRLGFAWDESTVGHTHGSGVIIG